jgi:hypothetical protein
VEKDWKLFERYVVYTFLGVWSDGFVLVYDTNTHGGGGDPFMHAGIELRIIPSLGK